MTKKAHKKFLEKIKTKIKPMKIKLPDKSNMDKIKKLGKSLNPVNCTYNGECPIIDPDCRGCDYET